MSDLTENFSRWEFACQCGCGFDTVDYSLLLILQKLRNIYGRCNVLSGCRCVVRNAATPGASEGSQHIYARAADVSFERGDPMSWAHSAELLGATGIGVYTNRIHIDTRSGSKAEWRGGHTN